MTVETTVARRSLPVWCRALALTGSLMFAGMALAQGDSMSSATYNTITDAQEMLGEDRNDEAYTELRDRLEDVDSDTMDEAMVLQMLGYTELARDNQREAIDYMRAALDVDKLPEQMKYELGYMVAQLYAGQEEYDLAIRFAEQWFETLEEPEPQQWMFMANLMAQTDRYERAIEFGEQAVAQSDEPRESWYQLLISASFQLEEYERAAGYLRDAVADWPDKAQYWEQLASVSMMLEQEGQALVALQLAWRQDLLEKENSIRSLIQLTISRGIPERGGRFLDRAFDRELLPRDETYLDLAVNAWISAREYDRAIAALEALSEVTGEGDPYLRAANIYVEQGRWENAVAALETAQSLSLEKRGQVWLTLGIALTEQEHYEDGLEAFRKARAFDDTRDQARHWLKYAEDLRRQHNWHERNSG